MKDTLVSTIDIDQEVEGIEGSGVKENQPDIKGSCEVHEPPSRFFKRPFSVPSPANHMRALLARVLGFFKWKEQGSMTRLQKSFGYVTGEQVKELGEQVEGGTGLDKSFGFSKNLIKMYEHGSMVGFGHFSYTCIATFKKGKLEGHHAAVKVISKAKMATAIAIDDVRREAKILRALKGHNNIVKFYDAYEDHDNVYIVMEYCAGGELLDSILARGGKYPEDDARTVVMQILSVVAFCHLQCVVHRDLKPENFMFISSDEDSPMKAIDFGLSDYVKPDQRLNDIVGTKYYVAPEVLHRSYSTEADMWNVGVIAYVLLSSTRPFWAQTASGIFRAVLRSDPSFDESPWPSLSTEAKDFVKRLLNKDHRKRMTAAQALNHLWLRNYNDLRVPLDILTFKLIKAYMHSSTLRKSASGALSKTLTPDDLSYMEEQFEQLEPDGSGTIGLENIKTALMKNATDAMKEGRYEDLLASPHCVHQLEALDQWEQQSRYAYELFDKDGNKVVITEELASDSTMAGGELVAGAALGLPFNILYDVIKEVMNKTTMFKPLLGDLSSTMESLQPLITDIAKHNRDLGRPEEELQSFKKQMENGAELVRKCSKVGLWTSYKKYGYANKLMDLDKSLNRLLAILSVQGIRAGMETLVVVKETLTTVRRIEDNGVGKEEKVVVHNLIEFQKGKLIGSGPFGPRYVASNRVTGALCSMKEVDSSPNGSISAKCLETEIRVLTKLRHPNIVEFYGSQMVGDRFYIYQEYVHPGSLSRYMNERYGAITESIVRNFTRQIMSGLAYMHSKHIAHRSIKGANLLVDSSGIVKLADFGMARLLSGHEGNTSLEGGNPYYWMAPELIISGRQSLAADIWSLGCTVIEMLTGRAHQNAYESMEALFKTSSGNEDNPELPGTLSLEGKNFVECCLRINPADRPTAAMLLEHPFLTSSSRG